MRDDIFNEALPSAVVIKKKRDIPGVLEQLCAEYDIPFGMEMSMNSIDVTVMSDRIPRSIAGKIEATITIDVGDCI